MDAAPAGGTAGRSGVSRNADGKKPNGQKSSEKFPEKRTLRLPSPGEGNRRHTWAGVFCRDAHGERAFLGHERRVQQDRSARAFVFGKSGKPCRPDKPLVLPSSG